LKLVFRDFLNAIDQASTRSTIDEGLGIGRIELEIGDDVGGTDPDGESPKPSCGANRLAMNREMTRNGSRTLGHGAHPNLIKILKPVRCKGFNKL
jgi:hypothetical protein